jgi:uncharacterized protein
MKRLFLLCLLFFVHPALAEPLTIHTAKGDATFEVEIAHTAEAQRDGLMFRKHLAPNAGMLFAYTPPHIVSMWMKNTLIPLDMLFIAEDGIIVHIAENAIPRDETVISSRYNVSYVLEVNGGTVKRQGIAIGDRISLPK